MRPRRSRDRAWHHPLERVWCTSIRSWLLLRSSQLRIRRLSLCFNPRGHGSLSAVDIGEHCEHDGSLWTPYLNPSTICAPFETRSTGASSVEPTRSLSWPTPCSPPPARFLRRST